MTTGTVFNIQHFTIHDGPGIRTELFLKGCPLRCRWCSNPEGLIGQIQPGVYRKKCLGEGPCDLCRKACPVAEGSPLQFSRGKLQSIDRTVCTGCMACADSCPSEAIRAWGQEITVEEAMGEIRRDKGYYDRSGGGVTLSGGEPLLQPDFVQALFRACRAEGIHTCLESCLHVPWASLEAVLPWTDLVIADIKLMDSDVHRKYTGAGNEQVLENLRRLAAYKGQEVAGSTEDGLASGSTDQGRATDAPAPGTTTKDKTTDAPTFGSTDQGGAADAPEPGSTIQGRPGAGQPDLILRIPVIPRVNDNQANMNAVAEFITKDLGGRVRVLQLLSYMRLGLEKYESLGMDYPMQGMQFQRPALQRRIQRLADYFNARGIHCTVGTHEKDTQAGSAG